MFKIMKKPKLLKEALKGFNRREFANVVERNEEEKTSLDGAQSELYKDPLIESLQIKEKIFREKYKMVHNAYLSFLKQKANSAWIKDEDTNSALFHAAIHNLFDSR